jgi:ribosomal protein L34E
MYYCIFRQRTQAGVDKGVSNGRPTNIIESSKSHKRPRRARAPIHARPFRRLGLRRERQYIEWKA